jgi:hypothetical protein
MDDVGLPKGATVTPGSPPPLRIGTAERNQAVDALREHSVAGRLDLDEFEERVGQAYSARTAGDLDALLCDLPPLSRIAPLAPPAAPPAARAVTPARRGADRGELSPYVGVNALLVFIWFMGGMGYFWPIWIIVPWGLAIFPAIFRSGHRHRAGQVGAAHGHRARRC